MRSSRSGIALDWRPVQRLSIRCALETRVDDLEVALLLRYPLRQILDSRVQLQHGFVSELQSTQGGRIDLHAVTDTTVLSCEGADIERLARRYELIDEDAVQGDGASFDLEGIRQEVRRRLFLLVRALKRGLG